MGQTVQRLTPEAINAKISSVNAYNTRQLVAAENNIPVVERIEKGFKVLKAIDLTQAEAAPYKDDVLDLIDRIQYFIDNHTTCSKKQQTEYQVEICNLLSSLITNIFREWDDKLNEYQS